MGNSPIYSPRAVVLASYTVVDKIIKNTGFTRKDIWNDYN